MDYRTFILALSLVALGAAPAGAREQIRIVGSSTVYPFVTVAAEQFGRDGAFKTPIVESTGTGGGFKLFCEGLGPRTPDISNASRPITDSEKKLCAKHGVTDIAEIPIGYDGIVIAGARESPALALSLRHIFLALARDLADGVGKAVPNPHRRWRDIDPSLPDWPIRVYGPPPTSGTRDAFVELAMEKGCDRVPSFAALYPDEKKRKKACHLIREDGAFIESGEDDNVIVQKLAADPRALGVLGFGFYEENTGKIQAYPIDGVLPDYESIESKRYPVSRSLYVYAKRQHIGQVSGLSQFLRELTGEAALGREGYMTVRGLLPLSESERAAMRAAVAGL